jgi:hypothetical protein
MAEETACLMVVRKQKRERDRKGLRSQYTLQGHMLKHCPTKPYILKVPSTTVQ